MNEAVNVVNTISWMHLLGAWLAVGLAGLWVALGLWNVARKTMEVMWKNPDISWKFLILTILAMALIEAAAIYGLIIAFQLVWKDNILPWQSIAAWIAVGLPAMATWIGQGFVGSSALDAVLRNPESQWKIMTNMILTLALIEAVAIYGLVIAFQLVWKTF